MNHPASYEYADGSANLYLLSSTELRYMPVTPEESSSGMYSGGKPKTVSLSPDQYKNLKVMLENALGNKSIHIADRIKMSGMISRMGGEKSQCIIQPNCAEMIAIEKALEKMLNK